MKIYILKQDNPYLNLAIEEYLFKNEIKEDIFLIWQNRPSVIIGKNQNPFIEVNLEYAKKNNIRIVRRNTGGGAVYHDRGNFNYTFISDKREDNEIDFPFFTAPIIKFLKYYGFNVRLNGRNDIVTEDGRKVSGAAEHTGNGRTLHHGTLLYNTDLNVLKNVLTPDEGKLSNHGIKSVRSRVANLIEYAKNDINFEQFSNNLSDFLIKNYNGRLCELYFCNGILELNNRYMSVSWNFFYKKYLSTYTLTRKKKYPFGTVEINMNITEDRIDECNICGDFFEISDISELQYLLETTRFSDIKSTISKICVSEYIYGMNDKMFCELLLGET